MVAVKKMGKFQKFFGQILKISGQISKVEIKFQFLLPARSLDNFLDS
jgi:hypothetical protein